MAAESGNRTAWEARSQHYGVSWRSVLFKGLPDGVNAHLHQWHTRFILRHMVPKPHLRILDMGCGYGRLTLPILQQFPEAEVLGVDVSATFVELFRHTTGQPAVLGSLEALPPDIGQFDYIICVTVLMYVEATHLQEALRNLLGLLRPGGTLLLIENDAVGAGCAFGPLTWIQRLLRTSPTTPTAHLFQRHTISTLVADSHGVIRTRHGLPFTTLCLLPLAALFASCPRFFLHEVSLRLLSWLDDVGRAWPLPSLYVGYVLEQSPTHAAASR